MLYILELRVTLESAYLANDMDVHMHLLPSRSQLHNLCTRNQCKFVFPRQRNTTLSFRRRLFVTAFISEAQYTIQKYTLYYRFQRKKKITVTELTPTMPKANKHCFVPRTEVMVQLSRRVWCTGTAVVATRNKDCESRNPTNELPSPTHHKCSLPVFSSCQKGKK